MKNVLVPVFVVFVFDWKAIALLLGGAALLLFRLHLLF